MTTFSRRRVLEIGAGTSLFALLAACSSDEQVSEGAQATADSDAAATTSEAAEASWERINLGFVSAYLLVRGGEATLLDTGNQGDEGDIEAMLTSAGLGWGGLSTVILTHSHGDHVGSAAAIAQAAPEAAFYAGKPDLAAIDIGREVIGVDDQQKVANLTIIATPGHTPGHIAALDTERSVLLAGDALISDDGALALPNPDFTPDYDEALKSVEAMAQLTFASAYVGHGNPVLTGADAQVRGLANS